MTTCYNSKCADQHAHEMGTESMLADALAAHESDLLADLPAWLSDMIIEKLTQYAEYHTNLMRDYQRKIETNLEPTE